MFDRLTFILVFSALYEYFSWVFFNIVVLFVIVVFSFPNDILNSRWSAPHSVDLIGQLISEALFIHIYVQMQPLHLIKVVLAKNLTDLQNVRLFFTFRKI